MPTFTRSTYALSTVQIVIILAIISILLALAVPQYLKFVKRVKVEQIVNKLGTFKLPLIDFYRDSGNWPTIINNVNTGKVSTDTFFADAVRFGYNQKNNKAWVGYQLSADYGLGWIFLVINANKDKTFDISCGSLNNSCNFGSCNSKHFYPKQCSESDIASKYNFEQEIF